AGPELTIASLPVRYDHIVESVIVDEERAIHTTISVVIPETGWRTATHLVMPDVTVKIGIRSTAISDAGKHESLRMPARKIIVPHDPVMRIFGPCDVVMDAG